MRIVVVVEGGLVQDVLQEAGPAIHYLVLDHDVAPADRYLNPMQATHDTKRVRRYFGQGRHQAEKPNPDRCPACKRAIALCACQRVE